LSALIEDLDDRGLLDSTLIVVTGEFGRTPKLNATAGDVLSVRFDVPEREVERDFGWRKYMLQFRGSTLADIQPRSKDAALIPLYPKERRCGNQRTLQLLSWRCHYTNNSPTTPSTFRLRLR